jgi:hypothetical protein
MLTVLFFTIICCEKESSRHNLKGVTFNNILLESNSTYKILESIVSYDDIIGYDTTNHIFHLSKKAGDKIREEKYPSTPTPFAILVDGEIIYIANFIPGYSSISCWECISVEPYSYDNKFRIQTGYPAAYYFTGEDPRNHSKILTKFSEDNKLIAITK